MVRTFLLLVLLTPAALRAEDRYHVQFAPDLERVSVEACFEGTAPSRLYRHRDAGRFTTKIRWGDKGIDTSSQSGRISLSHLPPDACINWQVDLAKAANNSDRRIKLHLEDSIVTAGNLWFWRDAQGRDIRVDVTLPQGYSISAPWQEISSTRGTQAFQVEPTSASWSSRIAVGRFPVQKITVAGTDLRLALVGRMSHQQQAKLASWITTTAQSVGSVFGHFPRKQPQILIIAIGPQREAVPWAHVLRGGGIASEFFVDETRPLDEFNQDWTATHELSHMLLPYISSKDRWFSEGLASYYQNVLRARDGRLSERQAWQKLHSGFQRGLAETRPASQGESLAQATASGWNSTMRVYWSGAAMMLEADARLRALSHGTQSLDTALAGLYDCCFDAGKRWRAREAFLQLDRLTGFSVFSDIYNQNVMNDEFPDMAQTYALLGLEAVNNSIQIKPDAPWGRIRHFIMSESAVEMTGSSSPGSP